MYLVGQLPYSFIKERFFTAKAQKSAFNQHATPFQDFVIRCVRYAFAKIPATIGKVFFSKGVALPFFWFRMLRHGYRRSAIPWKEVKKPGLHGIWMICDETKKPDIVVYYCHGKTPKHILTDNFADDTQAVASQWAAASSTSNSSSHG